MKIIIFFTFVFSSQLSFGAEGHHPAEIGRLSSGKLAWAKRGEPCRILIIEDGNGTPGADKTTLTALEVPGCKSTVFKTEHGDFRVLVDGNLDLVVLPSKP